MKLQLLAAVATTVLMAVPLLASANDQGWYVRGNVGYGSHTNINLTGNVVGDAESEGGVAGSLGIGYGFGNNWRVELDGAQMFSRLGALSQLPESPTKLRTTTAMVNAIYDFDDFGKFKPYVGAGVGYGRVALGADVHDFVNDEGALVKNTGCIDAAGACFVNGSDSGFGWQLLAGVGYDITENLVWDTHYRYQALGGKDFTGKSGDNSIKTHIDSSGAHMLMTGFRYKFGAPAPKIMHTCWDGASVENMASCPVQPPVVEYTTCWDGSQVEVGVGTCLAEPVRVTCWDNSVVSDATQCPVQPTFTCWDNSIVSDAAFCPAQPTYEQQLCANEYRQEIIYYKFNKPQSVETQEKIRNIVDTGANCAVVNIHVVGHTDSTGAAAYNLGLSKRRASDVRKELIRQGVSENLITSEGKGETELFIDTGDGVKEQLNRRTEVLIRLSSVGVVN